MPGREEGEGWYACSRAARLLSRASSADRTFALALALRCPLALACCWTYCCRTSCRRFRPSPTAVADPDPADPASLALSSSVSPSTASPSTSVSPSRPPSAQSSWRHSGCAATAGLRRLAEEDEALLSLLPPERARASLASERSRLNCSRGFQPRGQACGRYPSKTHPSPRRPRPAKRVRNRRHLRMHAERLLPACLALPTPLTLPALSARLRGRGRAASRSRGRRGGAQRGRGGEGGRGAGAGRKRSREPGAHEVVPAREDLAALDHYRAAPVDERQLRMLPSSRFCPARSQDARRSKDSKHSKRETRGTRSARERTRARGKREQNAPMSKPLCAPDRLPRRSCAQPVGAGGGGRGEVRELGGRRMRMRGGHGGGGAVR